MAALKMVGTMLMFYALIAGGCLLVSLLLLAINNL
jgi:hypothetical protein